MDIAQAARALGHPSRLRLLVALLQEPGSAVALSKRLEGMTDSDAHYHLTKLHKANAIEPYSTRPVRGTTETTFAVPKNPWWRSVIELLAPLIVQG